VPILVATRLFRLRGISTANNVKLNATLELMAKAKDLTLLTKIAKGLN
jgi:hypothetical protein